MNAKLIKIKLISLNYKFKFELKVRNLNELKKAKKLHVCTILNARK